MHPAPSEPSKSVAFEARSDIIKQNDIKQNDIKQNDIKQNDL